MAAKMVEDQCDAVDINFGCPQNIAKRGQYGSFLLEKPHIILPMVKALSEKMKIPVTCKMRILPSKEKTIELAKRLFSHLRSAFKTLAVLCCVSMGGLESRTRNV
jgi:tRNA-dihydrouridine synthase 1